MDNVTKGVIREKIIASLMWNDGATYHDKATAVMDDIEPLIDQELADATLDIVNVLRTAVASMQADITRLESEKEVLAQIIERSGEKPAGLRADSKRLKKVEQLVIDGKINRATDGIWTWFDGRHIKRYPIFNKAIDASMKDKADDER